MRKIGQCMIFREKEKKYQPFPPHLQVCGSNDLMTYNNVVQMCQKIQYLAICETSPKL